MLISFSIRVHFQFPLRLNVVNYDMEELLCSKFLSIKALLILLLLQYYCLVEERERHKAAKPSDLRAQFR